jgi:cyanophycinase
MRRGYIVLEGGAEFGGGMAEVDRRAIELAGGKDARLAVIPAAAAPDQNHLQAGGNGVRWFTRLGARHAQALPLTDGASANDPSLAKSLADSQFIYLLGGFPHYLYQTLAGSLCWQAMLAAYRGGAVLGGSSAGAMVLCGRFFDPETQEIIAGLNLLRQVCLIPHQNTFGKDWAARLTPSSPETIFIGIDEQTGIIDDGPDGKWTVYGKGAVTLYAKGRMVIMERGETFAAGPTAGTPD